MTKSNKGTLIKYGTVIKEIIKICTRDVDGRLEKVGTRNFCAEYNVSTYIFIAMVDMGFLTRLARSHYEAMVTDVTQEEVRAIYEHCQNLSTGQKVPPHLMANPSKGVNMPIQPEVPEEDNLPEEDPSLLPGTLSERAILQRTTPFEVTRLEPHQIFVFGSNEAGIHGAGAALTARRWGAALYAGLGLTGQTFAIPTKSGDFKTLGIDQISEYVDFFIHYARTHPHFTFLVTEIGCGLAGYDPEDIAPLFEECAYLDNVHLPARFWNVIGALQWA